VQMAGVLVLAAGVPRAAGDGDFVLATAGYVIMRLGLMAGWLRVARDQPSSRTRAARFAAGITAMQVLWLARLALPAHLSLAAFAVLAVGEMLVPVWAEGAADRPVFHPGHIEERYGLFTVIVLGESILSASAGFQAALDDTGLTGPLLAVGLGGLVIAFGAWWLYFDHPGHLAPTPGQGFRWGYGHVAVFAALASVGAGIQVAAEAVTGHGDGRVAALAVAVPVAGYLLGLVLIMAVTGRSPTNAAVGTKVVGAGVVLVVGLTAPAAAAVVGCAVVLGALALVMALTAPPPPRLP
jgi:low temperature requirement protein LtrA